MCIVGIYPSDYCSIPLCDNDRIYPFYRPWVGGRSGCLHFTASLILAPVDWYPCADVSLGGYLSCNNVCGSLTTHMCILKFHRNGKLFSKVVAPIHRSIIGGQEHLMAPYILTAGPQDNPPGLQTGSFGCCSELASLLEMWLLVSSHQNLSFPRPQRMEEHHTLLVNQNITLIWKGRRAI